MIFYLDFNSLINFWIVGNGAPDNFFTNYLNTIVKKLQNQIISPCEKDIRQKFPLSNNCLLQVKAP